MKLAFIFNPAVEPFRKLGEELNKRYGGVSPDEADVHVAVGGDGSVLWALPRAKGKLVYGLVPADSNSVGYLCSRYNDGDDLLALIAASAKFPLYPLEVNITYTNDHPSKDVLAFNTVTIERDSGQAAFLDLTAQFGKAAQTMRLVGDGVALSTALGSTALAYSHGGPILPLTQPSLVVTGMGIGRPMGFNPIVAYPGDQFKVDCIVSHGKRPIRVDVDGNTNRAPDSQSSISAVKISLSKTPYSTLAVPQGQFHPFRRLTS